MPALLNPIFVSPFDDLEIEHFINSDGQLVIATPLNNCGPELPQFLDRFSDRNLWPDIESPYTHPHTIRSEHDSAGFQAHPGDPTDSWRVELARFSVPNGYVGIVRAVEQYLSIDGTVRSVVGDPNSLGIWSMRLQPIQNPPPDWVSAVSPVAGLPGGVYSDWVEVEGCWFPAGSEAANNVHLVVPGGYTLRAFYDWPGDSSTPTVALMLRGSLHCVHAPETRYALRAAWH